MHGEEEFPRLRNRLFEHLVEHEGYRSIALESDCVAGLAVDVYVTEGVGSLDEVMRSGFSHGFGELAPNRELVQWMREYNQDRPTADRLRFFGVDAPMEMSGAASPRKPLTALRAYLAAHLDTDPVPEETLEGLIGDDGRWTDPLAAIDPSRSVGSSADVAALRLIVDDLSTLLRSESPHLIAASSYDEWWRACLYARTAAGLLRSHVAMAERSENRIVRLLALRDAMMAENIEALVETPTLLFAHNRHLQRDKSLWLLPPGWGPLEGRTLEWWGAGAIVGARLGDEYAFIAAALGAAPGRGLDAPKPDTIEGILSTLPESHHVLNAKHLAAALDGAEPTPRTDNTADYGYFALNPAHLAEADGVAFVKTV